MKIDFKGNSDKVDEAFRRAPVVMARALDRFLSRGAQEVAREMRVQTPKAFSTLTQSVRAEQVGFLHYRAITGVNYARDVEEGRPAGKMPGTGSGLMEWVRLRTKLQGKDLARATFAIARAIGRRGIKLNPFAARTEEKMESRVIRLVREGAAAGLKEVFG
ncbi:MAG: hypothetical protein LLG15_11250 [Betaproteobacteria bacterium]|nr:hypothetical protein [Betaproteobacteria bacterium]